MEKRELLLQLIKEQFVSMQPNAEEEQFNLGAGVIQKVMEEGLPIYQDQLKQLLLDQARGNVSRVIRQIEYDKKLKASQVKTQQIKIPRQTLRNQSNQRQPEQLQQTLSLEPIQQQLQQNIVTLFHNFTQLVANKISQNVQSNLNAKKTKKHKAKRSNTPKQYDNQSRPGTPTFDLKQQNQTQTKDQKQQQTVEEVYDDDFFEESAPDQKDFTKVSTNFNKLQNSKVSDEYNYTDDFVEDNQDTFFNGQKSNFYNPKIKEQQQQNNSDFSEDIDDLLQ